MNNRDETIREKLLERLTAVDVDARNLAIEVVTGSVIVRGSVPTEQQRERTIEALAGAHSIDIVVRPVAPSDSADGRGRSPHGDLGRIRAPEPASDRPDMRAQGARYLDGRQADRASAVRLSHA